MISYRFLLGAFALALAVVPLSGLAEDHDDLWERDDDRQTDVQVNVKARANVNADLPRGIQMRLEDGKRLPPGIERHRADRTAPVISNVRVDVQETTADIRWSTNEWSRGSVSYRASDAPEDPMRVRTSWWWSKEHRVQLWGLDDDTPYTFHVGARDRAGNVSQTDAGEFRTLAAEPEPKPEPEPDRAAPIISNIRVEVMNESSANIHWMTDENSIDTLVYWRADAGIAARLLGQQVVRQSEWSREHTASLKGMDPDTEYAFRISTRDRSGNSGTSDIHTFRTLESPPADTTAPMISNLRVEDVGESEAVVRWNTDEPSSGSVVYWQENRSVLLQPLASREAMSEGLRTDHEVSLTNLASDTEYRLYVSARDAAGNASRSEDASFRTLAPEPEPEPEPEPDPDTNPPNVLFFMVTNRTSTSADLLWVTNEAAHAYVALNGSEPEDASLPRVVESEGSLNYFHQLSLENLQPGTRYQASVGGKDEAGNLGTRSAVIETLPEPETDTTQPQIVFSAVVDVEATSARVVWVTNEPSDSRLWYGSESSLDTSADPSHMETEIGFVHEVRLEGLVADTTYFYVVGSADASANLGLSDERSFTTRSE